LQDKVNSGRTFATDGFRVRLIKKNELKFSARIDQAATESAFGAASMSDPRFHAPVSTAADEAQAALISRLARLDANPIRIRPPQSLQPTPEAAKTRVRRLQKKRLLIQKTQRGVTPHSTLPPARDPLAP
jgi:hypothetical protein